MAASPPFARRNSGRRFDLDAGCRGDLAPFVDLVADLQGGLLGRIGRTVKAAIGQPIRSTRRISDSGDLSVLPVDHRTPRRLTGQRQNARSWGRVALAGWLDVRFIAYTQKRGQLRKDVQATIARLSRFG